MATILQPIIGKAKKPVHNIKIDMTPMVDLGFLLITFFIFTTSLTQPTVTKLTMPKKGTDVMMVQEKTLLTAILDRGKVFVYEGGFDKAVARHAIRQTNYDVKSGLGRFIRQKQARLAAQGLKEEMMVVIKPLASSSYQNVMDALDEMLLNGISRYSVVDVSEPEKTYLAATDRRR